MKIAILLVALAAVIFVISRIRLWWREGRKLRQSGYLPPKPTWLAGAVMSIAARVLVFSAWDP